MKTEARYYYWLQTESFDFAKQNQHHERSYVRAMKSAIQRYKDLNADKLPNGFKPENEIFIYEIEIERHEN